MLPPRDALIAEVRHQRRGDDADNTEKGDVARNCAVRSSPSERCGSNQRRRASGKTDAKLVTDRAAAGGQSRREALGDQASSISPANMLDTEIVVSPDQVPSASNEPKSCGSCGSGTADAPIVGILRGQLMPWRSRPNLSQGSLRATITPVLYCCPNTGQQVQGFVADGDLDATNLSHGLCRVRWAAWVSRKTGRVLGEQLAEKQEAPGLPHRSFWTGEWVVGSMGE